MKKNNRRLFGAGMLTRTLALLMVVFTLCLTSVGCDITLEKPSTEPFNGSFLSNGDSTSEQSSLPQDNSTSGSQAGNIPTDSGITQDETKETAEQRDAEKALGVPAFSDKPYAVLNGNRPVFSADEITESSFEQYSRLDSLGRCGVTIACVGKDIMPTEGRESISSVKPTGWVNNKYDTSIVDGGYIYNRCHLIGFQLTGENANKNNLITGTRYMNVEGMLPFENMVADYVKETGNHVMYRVTPIYDKNDLVACGVQMEAYSVEDNGEGICFNVYVYNVQPGIYIDYASGENRLADAGDTQMSATDSTSEEVLLCYILNKSTKKIHHTTCSSAKTISQANREEYTGDIEELLAQGYTKCGICMKGE